MLCAVVLPPDKSCVVSEVMALGCGLIQWAGKETEAGGMCHLIEPPAPGYGLVPVKCWGCPSHQWDSVAKGAIVLHSDLIAHFRMVASFASTAKEKY